MADQREVPARAQVARRRRVPPGHLPRVVAPAPAPVRLRGQWSARRRSASDHTRATRSPRWHVTTLGKLPSFASPAATHVTGGRRAPSGPRAGAASRARPRRRWESSPFSRSRTGAGTAGSGPGRGDEQLQRPCEKRGRARDRAAALGRAVPAHHRGRAAEPVAPPAEPRRAVRRPGAHCFASAPTDVTTTASAPVGPRRAAGVERRDVADALSAWRGAASPGPRPGWSPPAATRTGGRASPAPRGSPPRQKQRRRRGAVVELEQDRVPRASRSTDPARAALAAPTSSAPAARRARCRGRARSTRERARASPSARSRAQPPVARPEQDLVHVRRRVAQDDARQVDVEHRTLPGTRRRARRPRRRAQPGRSPRRRRAGGRQPSRSLCGNQDFTARSPASSTSSSTPSTRRLLDGVAMPVPRRSTKPGRPRHRREMTGRGPGTPDAPVDFRTARSGRGRRRPGGEAHEPRPEETPIVVDRAVRPLALVALMFLPSGGALWTVRPSSADMKRVAADRRRNSRRPPNRRRRRSAACRRRPHRSRGGCGAFWTP